MCDIKVENNLYIDALDIISFLFYQNKFSQRDMDSFFTTMFSTALSRSSNFVKANLPEFGDNILQAWIVTNDFYADKTGNCQIRKYERKQKNIVYPLGYLNEFGLFQKIEESRLIKNVDILNFLYLSNAKSADMKITLKLNKLSTGRILITQRNKLENGNFVFVPYMIQKEETLKDINEYLYFSNNSNEVKGLKMTTLNENTKNQNAFIELKESDEMYIKYKGIFEVLPFYIAPSDYIDLTDIFYTFSIKNATNITNARKLFNFLTGNTVELDTLFKEGTDEDGNTIMVIDPELLKAVKIQNSDNGVTTVDDLKRLAESAYSFQE